MQESQPPIENIEVKRNLAKELNRKALRMAHEDETAWGNIVHFTRMFREKHKDSKQEYILLHDLIASTVMPDQESTMPLDTPDGEIEKFIKEELAKLG